MAQLVGTNCAICRTRITSESDARCCDVCGIPRHDGCARPTDSPAETQCRACGTTVEPFRTSEPAPVAPERFPVARACPNCRGEKYKRVKPLAWVAFKWDRVCKDCGQRYTPPTPVWAAVLFLGAGFLLAGFGLLSASFAVLRGNLLALACEGFLGVIGLLAIIHGFRSLVSQGKV